MNRYLRFFYFLFLAISLFSLNACEEKDKPKIVTLQDENGGRVDSLPLAAISFEHTEFPFGTIKEGEVVQHTFVFTNTGKAPLIVRNATASCGCTVPQWTKEAIAPGGTGKIDVTFNSTGKAGPKVEKKVTVYANTSPAETLLFIKGEVLAKESN